MPLYIGNKKVCPIVPTWRGFWSVTIKCFPGTIVDCGTQKTVSEDGKVIFKFAEAGTYTFIAVKGNKTKVLELELVEGEYFIEKTLYVGYDQLEYIEAEMSTTEANYIDLGIKGNQDIKAKLDCQFSSDSLGLTNVFFGSRPAENTNLYSLQNGSNNVVRAGYGSGYRNTPNRAGTQRHVYFMDKNLYYLDGTLVADLGSQTFTTPDNLKLFFGAPAGEYNNSTMGMKVYSLQIWQDEELVRDMIPVLIPDGRVGLYDNIEGKFYGCVTDYNYIPGPEA